MGTQKNRLDETVQSKKHVVGTQKNRLDETVLLSIKTYAKNYAVFSVQNYDISQNLLQRHLKVMDKKIFKFYAENFGLSKPM